VIGPGITYHLLHEAEGGGLARDPDVACGCLRRGHGACTARVGRGLRRRRYGWVGGGVARTEEREETLRMRGGSVLSRCVRPGDSCSGWWGLTDRRSFAVRRAEPSGLRVSVTGLRLRGLFGPLLF
jgi:hypothetical protein